MSMVKIRKISNGTKEMRVSKSAYNEYYKSAGWKIVDEKEEELIPIPDEDSVVPDEESDNGRDVPENEQTEDQEDISDEDWDSVDEEEGIEKPLSEMNGQELREKAASLGVDITGLTTNKQIRAKIKASMM